jgi:hypothetical protein
MRTVEHLRASEPFFGEMNMSKNKGLKPGQTAPKSGQYVQVGPRGGKGKEVTVVKGEPMPPTPKPGMTFTLTDATKNKSGEGK